MMGLTSDSALFLKLLVPLAGVVVLSCGLPPEAVDPTGAGTVSALVSLAQETVEDLVEEAFDRLDLTVLQAAMEARAALSQATFNVRDVMGYAIEELDGQQRRAVSDIDVLVRVLERELAKDAENLAEPIRQDAILSLSSNSGYLRLEEGFAIAAEEYIRFRLKGTGLSKARIRDFEVLGVPMQPFETKRDDTEIALRVSLVEDPVASRIRESMDEWPIEIPVSFSLEECSLFGLRCRRNRGFVLPGYVLPREIGVARAVFRGDAAETTREEARRGPFAGARVKSSWYGDPGERGDVFLARPDEGWRIDVESASVELRLLNGTCSGRRSHAGFASKDEFLLRVRVETVTERKPSVTCRSETTITFEQFRTDDVRTTRETATATLIAGETTVLELEETVELRSARLAHVVVDSSLLRSGRRVMRRGESKGGIRVEYDPANERVAYVSVDYVREM